MSNTYFGKERLFILFIKFKLFERLMCYRMLEMIRQSYLPLIDEIFSWDNLGVGVCSLTLIWLSPNPSHSKSEGRELIDPITLSYSTFVAILSGENAYKWEFLYENEKTNETGSSTF
jgi:hypothetical protein